MEVERAERFKFTFLEMFCHGCISFELLYEVRVVAAGVFDLPRFHRGVLADFVGGFARQAFLDEREQNRLAVPHAQTQAEIFFHVRRIDDDAVHQAREQAEHVIEQRAAIGEDDALDAAVADVALVPEGDVFQRRHRVATQHAREAGEAFPGDGIAFVRHGAAALLSFGERLFGFEHFGALQMTELHRPAFDARADERQRELKFRVDVALHDLRGDGRGTDAQFLADKRLDRKSVV